MTAQSDQTFCTIISSNYMHYALTLYTSLLKFNPTISLNILTTDNVAMLEKWTSKFPHLNIYGVSDTCEEGIGKELYDKYYQSHISEFRWSMKSVFMKFLMEQKKYKKVIWADADLFFVGDYQFLFDELNEYNVLLTPHWRNSNPSKEQKNFELLFVTGLYNAGFFAANQNAIAVLDWWANASLYKCEENVNKGAYYDQSYLNLIPIYFDKVKVLKHRGCNIADWNKEECQRTIDEQGNVLINHKWPIVFIHFTKYAIRGVYSSRDALLKPYLNQWHTIIKSYQPNFKLPIPKETKWKKNKKEIKRILKTLISNYNDRN